MLIFGAKIPSKHAAVCVNTKLIIITNTLYFVKAFSCKHIGQKLLQYKGFSNRTMAPGMKVIFKFMNTDKNEVHSGKHYK